MITMRSIARATVLLALLGSFTVTYAQIYKCENADGSITFSGRPCEANQDTDQVYPSTSPSASSNLQQAQGSQTENPYDRELTSLIAAALAQHDYAKAEQLAVTAKQWEMIRAARREDTKLKLRIREQKRRSRPILCFSSGNIQTFGDSQYSHGITTCH